MSGWPAFGAVLGLLLAGGGVGLLRLAWRHARPLAPTLAGWLLLAAGTTGWALGAAPDKAAALALLVPSLAAFAVLATGVEVRAPRRRPERMATELPARSGEASWRPWARTLYAGPVAGAAALLLGAAWALHGPGSEADRTGTALLATPALWAAALVWAVTDPRLARIGLGLAGSVLVGGLAAWL